MTRAQTRAALALVALVLGLMVVASWRQTKRAAAEARIERGQARAAIESGGDAVETVGAAGARERDSEALTRRNEQEIRNAKGADQKVDPAVAGAGLGSLCRRAAYRDDPRCRLLEPASR